MESFIAAVEAKALAAKSNARSMDQLMTEVGNSILSARAFKDIDTLVSVKIEDTNMRASHVLEELRDLKITFPIDHRKIMLMDQIAGGALFDSEMGLEEALEAFANEKKKQKAKDERLEKKKKKKAKLAEASKKNVEEDEEGPGQARTKKARV